MKNRIICTLLAMAVLLSLLSGIPMAAYATEGETVPTETEPEETTPETTDPTDSPEPMEPSEPTDPIEPTDSIEPSDPTEETDPTEESDPSDPTDESDATDPSDTEPTEETSEPTEPTEPTEPPPMTSSDDFIEVLKKMEGFHPVAYWDYSQWTIGYGTRCPEGKEKYYTEDNPMTVEEAVELLRKELSKHEQRVNDFADKHGLEFAQHQFDALVSLSYNCGSSWLYELDGYLNTAVREGDMSNRLVYGMLLWSKGHYDYILINRRKCEADMYINGIYKAYNTTGAVPSYMKHVFLDGNGGTTSYAIHGYYTKDPAGIVTDFTEIPEGVDENGNTFQYTFVGWFTEPQGGTEITILDGSLPNGTVLYAHWEDPQGNAVTLQKGDSVDNIEVKVTDKVKIRNGPGSYYIVLQELSAGTKLTITETFQVYSTLWGKCEYGWLSLNYTNYDDVISGNLPEETDGIWGTVVTQSGSVVNVRSGPGTSHGVVYTVKTGERVQIFSLKSDGTRQWGQLEDGNWICMDYVELDEVITLESVAVQTPPLKLEYVQMQDELDTTGAVLLLTYSDGSTKTREITADMVTGFRNDTLGEVTLTVTYEEKTATFTVQIIKATVVFQNYDGTVLMAAQYAYGEKVQLPETPTKPMDETYFYRFTGWDKEVIACAGDAVYTAVFEAVERTWGTVFTKSGDSVNVRKGPGTDYDLVYSVKSGTEVEVFERKSDGTRMWGQLEDGNWICLDYVIFGVVDGDMDGNFLVNEDDAIYLLRHVLVPDLYPVLGNADVNGDGTVNEDDAIYLLRHVLVPDLYPLSTNG